MPKQTFFNLPEEKKQKIIDCAIDEFSNYDFNQASINRIVKNAEISKGSFYQYFDDKLDLYKYIIVIIGEIKLEYFSKYITKEDYNDFFSYLKKMYSVGFKLSIERPKIAKIGDRLMKSDEKFKSEIYGQVKYNGSEFVEALINKGKLEGSIRKDIDSKFIAHLIIHLNIISAEFYYEIHDSFKDGYEEFFYDIIDVFENGIRAR